MSTPTCWRVRWGTKASNCGPATSGWQTTRSGSAWPTKLSGASTPSRRRAALVADATEFVLRIPFGPVAGFGEHPAEAVEQLQVLHRPAPIPRRVVLVVGPMVGMLAIGRFPGLTRRPAADDQVLPAVEVEHRHAALGQA